MTTIYDVAKKANVSKSSVSRYLNNPALLSEEVKARVEIAIKELNYHPSQIARTLSNKKSNLIALIIPYISHHFFSKLTEDIEKELFKKNYRLFMLSAKSDKKMTDDYLNVFKGFYVDGIIICNNNLNLTSYMKSNVPILSFDRELNTNIPCVYSDNYHGGVLATNYLLDKGCKKLGIIISDGKYKTKAKERIEAFEKICQDRQVPYEILNSPLKQDSTEETEIKIKEFLLKYPDIEGIFATTDDFGISTIRVAKMLGIEIPSKLQVIGFDDISFSSMIQPELTTIKQDTKLIAKAIVENLLAKINGSYNETKNEPIPVSLVVRNSTK